MEADRQAEECQSASGLHSLLVDFQANENRLGREMPGTVEGAVDMREEQLAVHSRQRGWLAEGRGQKQIIPLELNGSLVAVDGWSWVLNHTHTHETKATRRHVGIHLRCGREQSTPSAPLGEVCTRSFAKMIRGFQSSPGGPRS